MIAFLTQRSHHFSLLFSLAPNLTLALFDDLNDSPFDFLLSNKRFSFKTSVTITMMKLLAITLLSALVYAAPPTVKPGVSNVRIESITYGGSGCPQGTLSQVISADGTVFTVMYDNFVASFGAGAKSPIDFRKNCQLTVRLTIPSSLSFTVVSTDYRGFVNLAQGVTATARNIYYFSGDTRQAEIKKVFTGPVTKSYLDHVDLAVENQIWSQCNEDQLINFSNSLLLTGDKTKSGLITTDSTDGKVTQSYMLQWRAC